MWTILAQELKYYFKNRQEAIYIYSYFASILVLIPLAGKYAPERLASLAVVGLWIALTSAVAIAASQLFKRDQAQGRLEYYQLLPIALESIVFAKWLAFFLFITMPLAASIPLAGLLYTLSALEMLRHLIGLTAGAACLSILSALVAALTNGLEKAGAVLSLIILPLSIPVLIFGAQYSLETSSLWQPNLWFMLGFSAFMLPILCFAGAYSIRASN